MSEKVTPIIPTLSKKPVNPYGTPVEKKEKKFDFTKDTDKVKAETTYTPVIEKKDKEKPDNTDPEIQKGLEKAVGKTKAHYEELIAAGDKLFNEYKLDEAEAAYKEALELDYDNDGANAKLKEVAELRAEEELEAKVIARAKELIAAEKGLKEVADTVNAEFKTEYTWQKLSALVKGTTE